MNKINNNNKGFTLIEILATVSILAILAIVIIPSISDGMKSSRDEYNSKLKKQLLIAGKLYFSENKQLLPKITYENQRIEDISYVTVSEMKSLNYLTKDFIDSDGDKCDESFVVATKHVLSTSVKYRSCLICGDKNYSNKEPYCKVSNWKDKVRPTCYIDSSNKNSDKIEFENLNDYVSDDSTEYGKISQIIIENANTYEKIVSDYDERSNLVDYFPKDDGRVKAGEYNIYVKDEGGNTSFACNSDGSISYDYSDNDDADDSNDNVIPPDETPNDNENLDGNPAEDNNDNSNNIDDNNNSSDSSTSIVKVTGISLNSSNGSISLNKTNKTVALTATVYPSNATNKGVVWSSSNINVATVNSYGVVTAKAVGFTTITARTIDGSYVATYSLSVTKRVAIVIGASQVTRMKNWVTSYSSSNYNYRTSDGSLVIINKSGTGIPYQYGDGFDEAKATINSYSKLKNNVNFYIFFPLSGNTILKYNCGRSKSNQDEYSISSSNAKMKSMIKGLSNVIGGLKSNGYNAKGYVISMHPVVVSQSSSSYVVKNENSNSCKTEYRSNRKYYKFNKAINTIITNSYTSNLKYVYVFEQIMKVPADENKNYSYRITYNTTDGVHWNKSSTLDYTKRMFNTSGDL